MEMAEDGEGGGAREQETERKIKMGRDGRQREGREEKGGRGREKGGNFE